MTAREQAPDDGDSAAGGSCDGANADDVANPKSEVSGVVGS